MGNIFNGASNDDQSTSVSLNALRGQVMQRLAGIHRTLDSKGIGAAFTRSASRPDPIGDLGFLGGMMLDMVFYGLVSSFVNTHFHLGHPHAAEAFHAAVMGSVEGMALLRDQDVETYRARKLDDYPEGRRKSALDDAVACGRKFNLVSGSQRHRLSFDTQADLACMYEMLDMLDALEKDGIRMIRLDKKKPVYDVLKRSVGQVSGKGAIRSFAQPMLKAV